MKLHIVMLRFQEFEEEGWLFVMFLRSLGFKIGVFSEFNWRTSLHLLKYE